MIPAPLEGQIDRRQFIARAGRLAAAPAAGGLLGAALAACGQKSDSTATVSRVLASSGTTIPGTTINWAMAPFPDETLAVVGMRLGYFHDVGITIGPTPTGAKLDLSASIAPLLANQVQVGSGVIEVFESELDNVNAAKVFLILDTFEGFGFFAPPGTPYKSISEFMALGQPFATAMRNTMAQLKGKRVALATDPAARLFYNICFDLGGITFKDVTRSDLSNPNIVNAAFAGKTDIPAPSGGVEIIKLEKSGFKTLVDEHLLINLTNDVRKLQLVTHSTYVARSDVYAGQYETILRAASVIFRILDDVKQNPAKVAAAQLPFLNAYTGTPLSPANLDAIHQSITVLRDFEGQSEFFDQPSSANDIFTNGQAQIDALVAQKVLKRQHTVSEVDGAKRVWDDLRTYRAESDKLMPKVAAKNPSLAAMAKAQYDARNYLDAYRFLASAKA